MWLSQAEKEAPTASAARSAEEMRACEHELTPERRWPPTAAQSRLKRLAEAREEEMLLLEEEEEEAGEEMPCSSSRGSPPAASSFAASRATLARLSLRAPSSSS